MSKLKPYTKYKDSGLKWLGDIPEDWDLVKNKAIFKEKKNIVGKKSSEYTLLSLTLKGIIDRDMDNPQGKFPESFDTYKIVEENDLVFCLFDIAETPRTVGVVPHTGMITGAYTTFSVQNTILPEYIYYYYLSLDNNKALGSQYSGLRNTINVNRFLNLQSPKPPIDVQKNIVSYLNTKSKEIDKSVKKLKKEIALLKEHRQKIISQAVTCGLDENGKLREKPEWSEGDPVPKGWKDSGVDWMGLIPEGWDVRRTKFIFKEKSERKEKLTLPLLTFSRKKGLILFTDANDKLPSAEDLSNYKVCRNGDLLMNRMQAWSGMFTDVNIEGVVSPDYAVYKPNNNVNVTYFAHLYRTDIYISQFIIASKGVGSGFNRLYNDKFGNIFSILPTFREQTNIVDYLERKTETMNTQICKIEDQIEFIKEYKQSLISKVVTGKIDVRNINNNLSED